MMQFVFRTQNGELTFKAQIAYFRYMQKLFRVTFVAEQTEFCHIFERRSYNNTDSVRVCVRTKFSAKKVRIDPSHVKHFAFCLTMQCFGDVFEEEKH